MVEGGGTRAASLPPGARCAVHPEREARTTCPRCGSYCCESCVAASGRCHDCDARAGVAAFPFDRRHFAFGGLFDYALARWKQCWLPLGLSLVAFMVVVYAVALGAGFALGTFPPRHATVSPVFGPRFWVGQIIQLLVQVALELPLLGLYLDVAAGKPPALEPALRRLRRLPQALLQVVIMTMAFMLYAAVIGGAAFGLARLAGMTASGRNGVIAIAAFIGAVPAVYLGIGLMFALLALLDDPSATAVSALRTSLQLVSGQRLRVLGISLLTFALGGAGFLACCVGGLASAPLSGVLFSTLFLALRNDAAR